jgi:hypothetical protein
MHGCSHCTMLMRPCPYVSPTVQDAPTADRHTGPPPPQPTEYTCCYSEARGPIYTHLCTRTCTYTFTPTHTQTDATPRSPAAPAGAALGPRTARAGSAGVRGRQRVSPGGGGPRVHRAHGPIRTQQPGWRMPQGPLRRWRLPLLRPGPGRGREGGRVEPRVPPSETALGSLWGHTGARDIGA